MVQLVVVKNTRNYELREVFVNPRHVVMLREDHATRSAINEGKVIEGIDPRQQYTRITVDNGTTGSQFVVVGSPGIVESKLNQEATTQWITVTTHYTLKKIVLFAFKQEKRFFVKG